MPLTIADRLRSLYDNLVITINFVINEIKRVKSKEFYEVPIPESQVIGNVTYMSYSLTAGKTYDIDLNSVSNSMFNLVTETSLLTSECPEWHFFFTAGSDSPVWARELSSITVNWATEPSFESGTRYEIDIIYINKTTGSYEGLVMAQE